MRPEDKGLRRNTEAKNWIRDNLKTKKTDKKGRGYRLSSGGK